MTKVKSIEASKYNSKLAEALKDEASFEKPDWIEFVKSGASRSRPIEEKDFWHKRAASILRQIYIKDVVGVQRLRTRYGKRKDRGSEPKKFGKSGGKIIRLILQQSDEAGFTEKVLADGKRKGRRLTKQGREFMEEVAKGVK